MLTSRHVTKIVFFFQFAVPKNGGLHVAMLTQKGQETRGLPTTVIKMLPVEVMVFVDMIPYVFANRHHGKHIYWTSMAALVNYKKWIDASLETKDLDFLNQVLTCLKTKRFNDLIEGMLREGECEVIDFDIGALERANFLAHDETIKMEHFNQALLNLVFELKFKLVGFEGRDDFAQRARVVPREPPKVVLHIMNGKYHATYDVGLYVMQQLLEEGEIVESVFQEPEKSARQIEQSPLKQQQQQQQQQQQEPVKEKEKKVETVVGGSKRKRDSQKSETVKSKKKGRVSDEEWSALAKMLDDDGDFFESSQPPRKAPGVEVIEINLPKGPQTPPEPERSPRSESPYLQCAQPREEDVAVEKSPSVVAADTTHLRCIHIHIGDRQGSKVLSFDLSDGGVKIAFE